MNYNTLIFIPSVLGSLGMLISLTAVLITGGWGLSIIYKPLLSALGMAVLGVFIYFILQWKAPNMLVINEMNLNSESSLDNDLPGDLGLDPGLESEAETEQDILENQIRNEIDSSHKVINYSAHELDQKNIVGKKNFVRGNQILVEGVPLENKPELMAKAIQHIIDQDEGKN